MKDCNSKNILTILGKKWNLLIIRALEIDSRKRFNELSHELKITAKVLDARLKELEKLGLVKSERFSEVPPRVEYFLTKKGFELTKCFKCIDDWSKKYN